MVLTSQEYYCYSPPSYFPYADVMVIELPCACMGRLKVSRDPIYFKVNLFEIKW